MRAKKQAIGVCLDGTDLKIAVLSRERGAVRVVGLVRHVLPSSLEKGIETEGVQAEKNLQGEKNVQLPAEQPEEDAFGLEGGGEFEGAEEISNQNVFLELLGKFSLKKWSFAVNMLPSKVYYYEFEEDFGLKNRNKLRKRLRKELQNSYQMDFPLDAIDSLRSDEGRLLAVAHDNGLAILDFIEGVKSFLHGAVKVAVADTNEIAVMNLVRAGYSFSEQEVVAVVYIGDEFSRVLFMRGNRYLRFGGIVNEGKRSSRVLNALFSRIMLEQDVYGMPDIDRFLLSGDCGELGARTFFADQFPDAQVDYLVPPQLDVGWDGDDKQNISTFAIPIGLAWKTLGAKKGTFYDTDFVPMRIRDRQNAYKMAWHGFLMIGLLGVAVLTFLGQWRAHTEAIRDTRRTIHRLESSISAVEAGITSTESLETLHGQIGQYDADIAFANTLSRGAEKWSPILEQLAVQTKSQRSVWFENFVSGGDQVMLKGHTLYRSRIPKISERLGDALLQTVSTAEVRGRNVYQFDLRYALQPDQEEGE